MSVKKKGVPKRPTKKMLGIKFVGVDSATKANRKGKFKFRSRISLKGTTYYLGVYDEAEEAAVAYNKKAKNLFGSEKKAKQAKRWNVVN